MTLRTFDEVLARLDALERAPASRIGGAWPLAQALAHCAQSIEYSVSGYPKAAPFVVRKLVGPMVKRKFLRKGAVSHDREKAIPGADAIPADTTLPDAVTRLRQAIDAFRAHSGDLPPHFAYGPCSRAEVEALQAMHVGDHLRDLHG